MLAGLAAGKANTPRTLFCIGSMNKMLTGVAVAQLVGRGRLSFDDTVVRSRRPVDVNGMAHPYALVGPDGRPLALGPMPGGGAARGRRVA